MGNRVIVTGRVIVEEREAFMWAIVTAAIVVLIWKENTILTQYLAI